MDRKRVFAFGVFLLMLWPALAAGITIEDVFPGEGMTVGGTVPVLANIVTGSESASWRVYDSAGTIDVQGSGTSICVYWNARTVAGTGDRITIEASDDSGAAGTSVNVQIDPALYANPSVNQLSSNPPDTERMFCGGNLHRGSERISPTWSGDLAAFMSNAYSVIPEPRYPVLPICQNCEIFTNTYNGRNLLQWTENTSGQTDWKAERVGIDATGAHIVFTSSADLLGTNPHGVQQVYLLSTRRNALQQMTFFEWGEFAERATISGDALWIAFNSNANQLGTNPDRLKQVFVIDVAQNLLRQLAYGTDGETRTPFISGNGSLIAFSSSHNLTGQNPNLVHQIFVVRNDGTGLRQLTFSNRKSCSRPALDIEGRKVVFLFHANSPEDKTIGKGADIFSMNTDGTGTFRYTHVTDMDVQLRPHISPNGEVIAWESTADLAGRNGDLSREIYVVHTNKRDFKQITDSVAYEPRRARNVLCQRPYLNRSGSKVFFECTADLTGYNPDLWLQVFSAPTGY